MKLLAVGNVVVDILARVPALPEPGGDVLATASGMSPGGSFNTMFAATRQGLPTAYAGGHGTGFFGDLIRSRLEQSGIEVLMRTAAESDSGYDVALIDASGERTFVTAFGAEATLTADQLSSLWAEPTDLVYLSGYSLLEATNGVVLEPWLARLDPGVRVLLDPGPLVADIPPSVWATALARADWLSCNGREAELLTGVADPRAAIELLATQTRGVLLRLGEGGCLVATDGEVTAVPAFSTEVVDTNGAGDAHAGAFLAALAAGLTPVAAATRANACAAIAVGRFGPATAPSLEEVLELIRARGRD